jgi:hypothetical protein
VRRFGTWAQLSLIFLNLQKIQISKFFLKNRSLKKCKKYVDVANYIHYDRGNYNSKYLVLCLRQQKKLDLEA